MKIRMEELSRRMVGTDLVDVLVANLDCDERHARDAVNRIGQPQVIITAASHSREHNVPLDIVIDHVVGKVAEGKPYYLAFKDAPTSYLAPQQGGNAI